VRELPEFLPHLYILDAQRQPIRVPPDDGLRWARWLAQTADRTVGLTQAGHAQVSTVFVGLDYFGRRSPPLLFETLVVGGPFDGVSRRYATWEEAERGHATMSVFAMCAAVSRLATNGFHGQSTDNPPGEC